MQDSPVGGRVKNIVVVLVRAIVLHVGIRILDIAISTCKKIIFVNSVSIMELYLRRHNVYSISEYRNAVFLNTDKLLF